MQVIIHPERKDWSEILQRPYADNTSVLQSVQQILADVKEQIKAIINGNEEK